MFEKRIVREGSNQVAEKYLERRHVGLKEMIFLHEFRTMIKRKGKILDAGCGGGLPFTKCLSKYFDVIGIDISEKQIELAKKNVPKAQFYVKDMTKLDFPEHSFDGILAYHSIIYVPREENYSLYVNFYRMLKPNGIALFSLHKIDDPGSIEDDFFDTKMHWSGFDKNTNIKMLKEIGFELIWSKLVGYSLGGSKYLFVLLRKP